MIPNCGIDFTQQKLRVLQIGLFFINFLTENYLALSDDLILQISRVGPDKNLAGNRISEKFIGMISGKIIRDRFCPLFDLIILNMSIFHIMRFL